MKNATKLGAHSCRFASVCEWMQEGGYRAIGITAKSQTQKNCKQTNRRTNHDRYRDVVKIVKTWMKWKQKWMVDMRQQHAGNVWQQTAHAHTRTHTVHTLVAAAHRFTTSHPFIADGRPGRVGRLKKAHWIIVFRGAEMTKLNGYLLMWTCRAFWRPFSIYFMNYLFAIFCTFQSHKSRCGCHLICVYTTVRWHFSFGRLSAFDAFSNLISGICRFLAGKSGLQKNRRNSSTRTIP